MKKKAHKIIAVYLALNILFEIFSPTVAWALTTGPSQPEMQSFEPIGTTEMVDPFSGDFNYNIPLMTVPGPNGGYPINMAYHAGIGMEQEASWVGLGWNINAGEINRQMRGLPDDFDGDIVQKVMYMKPNITASIKAKLSIEMASMDAEITSSTSIGLTYNSYHGIGITAGKGFSTSQKDGNGFGLGVNSNYNSLSGETDLSASLSYSKKQNDEENKFGLSFTYGSVEGAKSLAFDQVRTKKTDHIYMVQDKNGKRLDRMTAKSAHSAGVSFSNSSYIPNSEMPREGFSVSTGFDFGTDVYFVNPYSGGEAFYTQDKIKTNSLDMKAYGYLYSQHRKAEDSPGLSIMDFNREKDFPLTKDIPAMPVPVFTNDIYFVQGQGIGGAFRPYRSDVGILHDPVVRAKNMGGDVSAEVAVGSTIKFGTDLTLTYSKAYSGPWQDEDMWDELEGQDDYEFKDIDIFDDPLFQPAYFRSAGDKTANYNASNTTIQGVSDALPISIVAGFDPSLIISGEDEAAAEIEQPFVDFKVGKGSLGAKKMSERPSRSQSMSCRYNWELVSPNLTSRWSNNTIYSLNDYPRNSSGTTPDYSSGLDVASHIGEITVLNPDGNRYVYGIPAFNILQKEVSFSVEGGTSGDNIVSADQKLVDYKLAQAGSGNDKGNDNFYSYKSMPAYAHSYMLTAIVSPDYVDLTDNGLTEDDYGYYVKFNYTKYCGADDPYLWRSPYTKASYIQGFESDNAKDDKAGYTYGSKEIWYLNSIETKTHIAEFSLSDRRDGFGANNEHNGAHAGGVGASIWGKDQQKLDCIKLYSKADPEYASGTPIPIKTVNFDYTYDLCGGVLNNDGGSDGSYYTGISAPPRNDNSGKLTLKKVWFTYMNNNKGSVSPYEFDYHERNTYGGTINLDENPNFSSMQMDRWGNYKSAAYDPENPYTDQNSASGTETDRNNFASAWCLKEISLPSGGKIKVNYESDDYGYVQNKQAMQMAEIMGTGRMAGSVATPNGDDLIDGNNLLIFFKLENQYFKHSGSMVSVATYPQEAIWEYVKNIDDLYFKSYQRLKPKYVGGPFDYDYVSGYAKIDAPDAPGVETGDHYGVIYDAASSSYIGYVKLKEVNVHDNSNSGGDKTHPFRKAGWQYLKLNRPDLLYPSSVSLSDNPAVSELLGTVTDLVGFFTSNFQLFAGYYNYCAINGFCKQLDLDSKSSFIRLNTPDYIKYGGGHRVQKLSITDTWTETGAGDTESEYGQEYSYVLPDGSSSGVAEYEPLIGGEEISLRKPIRYSTDYLLFNHKNLYMEEPFCESYYPAAGIGYSRVIVKGIQQKDSGDADVTKGVQGISVYEFYTAKDFPVQVSQSALTHRKFTPDISIPFIGNVSFENHGCSQTYTVETNDMHGKMKSMATYAYGTNLLSSSIPPPVSKTEYIYKTQTPYSSVNTNKLSNWVDVLFKDAAYTTSELGVTKEFFLDMRQRSNVSMTNGGQVNVEISFYPVCPLVSFIPKVSYAEGMNKSVVGMNVISRNGILTETKVYSDGAMASTKNLMFDAATGKPLLTSVTNDFEAPVYTYGYAAQWAYDGMGAAYKNVDAMFVIDKIGSGIYEYSAHPTVNLRQIFSVGDQLEFIGAGSGIYHVETVSSSQIQIRDVSNNLYSSSDTHPLVKIVRSGRRNLLDASNGKIVSLSNPVTARKFPLFDEWNAFVTDIDNVGALPTAVTFTECASGRSLTADVTVTTAKVEFDVNTFTTDDEEAICGKCKCTDIYAQFALPLYASFTLKKMGNYVVAYEYIYDGITTHPTGNSMIGTWNDGGNGSAGCLRECLDDVLHADALELKSDFGYDYADVDNNQMDNNGTPADDNGYQFGTKGIWRPERSWVYQVERKQGSSATDISKDGTYKDFVLFEWTGAADNNPKWTWTNKVTKYNPYGYEIENIDRMYVYSSALYGYNNSVPVSIASNSSYYESAFESFEDYKNSDYSTASTGHKHGHVNLVAYSSGTLSLNDDSHTGGFSLQIPSGASARFGTNGYSPNVHFTPETGSKKYIISAWFKGDAGTTPAITIPSGGTVLTTTVGDPIEGWRKCDVVFTASSTTMTFDFNIGSSTLKLIDDIRITPFSSGVKSYVYNPQTLWLVAELDNQNYATFYNYDQEGTLVQVKKETAAGVRTLKTTRSNTKRINP